MKWQIREGRLSAKTDTLTEGTSTSWSRKSSSGHFIAVKASPKGTANHKTEVSNINNRLNGRSSSRVISTSLKVSKTS